VSHPKAVAAKIKAYIEPIRTHLYNPKPANRCELSSLTPKWVPPPIGLLLVNVDATMFAYTRQMGVGVVSRDHNGSFITACGERYEEVVNPKLAEALAIRRDVSFALDEGYSRVIFSSDCLTVIQRVGSPVTDRSICGSIIEYGNGWQSLLFVMSIMCSTMLRTI
jgi:hypothetical protein